MMLSQPSLLTSVSCSTVLPGIFASVVYYLIHAVNGYQIVAWMQYLLWKRVPRCHIPYVYQRAFQCGVTRISPS